MILGRKARDRMATLERIAATRFIVEVAGDEVVKVTAEQAYMIAKYGGYLGGRVNLVEGIDRTLPGGLYVQIPTTP